jgi:uncharacterized UBP type Zn finger protein
MSRIFVFGAFVLVGLTVSCERCMRCRYSYTETVIVETPDGEEEEVVEYEDQILLDEEGAAYGDECVKYSEYKDNKDGYSFDIETYYELEAETTELDDFEYTCSEL